MFIFLAKHELLELSQKYPEDIILHINRHIKGARELRTVINQAIESPYGNEDNWDGIYEALGDLSWWTKKNIRIVHTSLPCLMESEMETYLSVLYDNDFFWEELMLKRSVTNKQVIVYFSVELKEKVMKVFNSIGKKRHI